MKEITVGAAENGLRLNKFLNRLLPNAGTGFLYKMLRKKNITLNALKADGSETLSEGDIIRIFFSDETFEGFRGKPAEALPKFAEHALKKEQIIYEDDSVIIAYKPAGLLSQKDKPESESVNERILQYLADSGKLSPESLAFDRPSVCNRLDRNTPGLILFGKTQAASRELNRLLRERILEKYYYAVVIGHFAGARDSNLYLTKNPDTNTVTIGETPAGQDSVPVRTSFTPVLFENGLTLLRIRLHTGKSHQIRAVLSYLGYPIAGDPKYRDVADDDKLEELRRKYRLRSQLLLAYALRIPESVETTLSTLKGKTFCSVLPKDFAEVLTGEFHIKGDYHAVLQIPGTPGLPL